MPEASFCSYTNDVIKFDIAAVSLQAPQRIGTNWCFRSPLKTFRQIASGQRSFFAFATTPIRRRGHVNFNDRQDINHVESARQL
jgi:hypothetical protein